jgi:hypothetical protein
METAATPSLVSRWLLHLGSNTSTPVLRARAA